MTFPFALNRYALYPNQVMPSACALFIIFRLLPFLSPPFLHVVFDVIPFLFRTPVPQFYLMWTATAFFFVSLPLEHFSSK